MLQRASSSMKVAGAGDVYRFSGGCKILLTSEDGDTFVKKGVESMMCWRRVRATRHRRFAISDGMIFIRGEKQFFCFRNPKRRGKRLEDSEGRKSRE
jgi:hypothetical protein